jgi:hypothetical protein
MKPDVRAAHDHRDAPVAELAGNVVSAKGMDRPGRDSHQVRIGIETEVLDLLVDQSNVPVGGSESCEIRKCQRNESSRLRLKYRSVGFRSVVRRLNDQKLLAHVVLLTVMPLVFFSLCRLGRRLSSILGWAALALATTVTLSRRQKAYKSRRRQSIQTRLYQEAVKSQIAVIRKVNESGPDARWVELSPAIVRRHSWDSGVRRVLRITAGLIDSVVVIFEPLAEAIRAQTAGRPSRHRATRKVRTPALAVRIAGHRRMAILTGRLHTGHYRLVRFGN